MGNRCVIDGKEVDHLVRCSALKDKTEGKDYTDVPVRGSVGQEFKRVPLPEGFLGMSSNAGVVCETCLEVYRRALNAIVCPDGRKIGHNTATVNKLIKSALKGEQAGDK